MWFHDIARYHANRKARAGDPQNQITFEMLTGTGQFDAAATAAKSLQSCPTLCDPIDVSPPGSPAPGIL